MDAAGSQSEGLNPFEPPKTEWVTPPGELRPLAGRAAAARWTLAMSGALALAGVGTEIYGLAGAAEDSARTPDITPYDYVYGGVGCVQSLAYIATVVAFCLWFHRAHARLAGVEPRGDFTPGWAVGWWFIPIASLWKPFQATRQLWRRSHFGSTWRRGDQPGWLGVWWTLWIVGNVLSNGAMRASLATEAPTASTVLFLLSDAVEIPAALLAMLLIDRVTKAQRKLLGCA